MATWVISFFTTCIKAMLSLNIAHSHISSALFLILYFYTLQPQLAFLGITWFLLNLYIQYTRLHLEIYFILDGEGCALRGFIFVLKPVKGVVVGYQHAYSVITNRFHITFDKSSSLYELVRCGGCIACSKQSVWRISLHVSWSRTVF